MMTTTLDIVDTLFALLDSSALKAAISGKIYLHRRLAGSEKEDVVINSLPVENSQLSKATANVNIHVPDIDITVDGITDKQPNHDRLKALADIARDILEDNWTTKMNYAIEQQLLIRDEEAHDHYINFRIKFFIQNL